MFCLPCIRHYVSLGVDLNELLLRDGGAQAMGTTGMMTFESTLAIGDVYVSEARKNTELWFCMMATWP